MKLVFFAIVGLLSICSTSSAAEMTGREIMEKQKELQKVNTEIELQKMILVDKSGAKSNREVRRKLRDEGDDNYKTLIVFMEPSDIKGTALRTIQHKKAEDEQFLFLPARGKPQRIAKGSKKNYFMGTDYTYEDLQSEELDDFEYKFLRKEECHDKDKNQCFVVQAIPTNKEVRKESGYGKRILWIRTDIFATAKTEYYSKREKLVKTQFNYDFQNIKGTVWRAKRALMDNKRKKHKTLTASVTIEINKDIDSKVFTDNYVLKGEHTK